jgi:hypothetical protein
MDSCIIRESQTDYDENCTADPIWKEPCILDTVEEQGCFLRIVIMDDIVRGQDDVELAEVVMTLEEAYQMQLAPLEKKYDAKLLVPKRRHDNPVMYVAFGEMGGTLSGQRGVLTDDFSHLDPDGDGVVTKEELDQAKGRGDAAAKAAATQKMIPPLAQVLQARGLAVPVQLSGVNPHMTLTPPPRHAAALEADSGKNQRAAARLAAEDQCGVFRGAVPMSYLQYGGNPHAAWIYNPPRRC